MSVISWQLGYRDTENTITILGAGGTISSTYKPALENINSSYRNPIFDLRNEISEGFGIVAKNLSSIPVLNKDSRKITPDDMKFILDVCNGIKAKSIIVTCGTYGLPLFTQIIAKHILPAAKDIVVTGSMLPPSHGTGWPISDIDINCGAALATINTLRTLRKQGDAESRVFASFHGDIFTAEQCKDLTLHPDSHKDVELYRGQVIHPTREIVR